MVDDFTGSLSQDQDPTSLPAPVPPVDVDENLKKEKQPWW